MFTNKHNFGVTSGLPRDGAGRVHYALLLDVLTFTPGLMLACAVLYFQSRLPLSRGLLLLLTLPSFAGLILSIFCWRIKLLAAVIAVASYWGVLAMLLILGMQGFAVFFWVLLPLMLLFLVALSTSVLMAVGMGWIWAFGATVAGLLCGIVSAADHLDRVERKKHPVLAQDPLPVAAELNTINKCAHLFRLLHPEAGYPESLLQLGPQGIGCLPEALLTTEHKGFLLVYQPGVKDASGRIESYAMKAEQAPPHGPDFSVISSDESGLILYRFEGPHGGGILYPYSSIASSFQHLIRCLKGGVAEHKSAVDAADQSVQTCWSQSRLGEGYTTSRGNLTSHCFNITYRFETSRAGVIDGFVATGRPAIYGDCGIRSYLIDAKRSSLKMYATAENRPATRSDPQAKLCELKDPGDCSRPAEIE